MRIPVCYEREKHATGAENVTIRCKLVVDILISVRQAPFLHLRRHPRKMSFFAAHCVQAGSNLLAQAKVGYFDYPILRDEYVVWLDITMDYLL